MDSAPAISEAAVGSVSPAAGFGRGLAHRMNPQVTVVRRTMVQPGFIARRSQAFGSYVGQSQVSRWSIGAGMQRGQLSIRPPIDYWPWATTEEPAPAAVPRYERSLPRMAQLRRRSDGQPGTMAKAMKPETIDPRTVQRAGAKSAAAPKVDKMAALKEMLQRTGRIPADGGDTAEATPSPTRGGTFMAHAASPSDRVARRATDVGQPPRTPSNSRPPAPRATTPPAASPAPSAMEPAGPAAPRGYGQPSGTVQRSLSNRPAPNAPASTRGPRPLPASIAPALSGGSSPFADAATEEVSADDLAARIQATRSARAVPTTSQPATSRVDNGGSAPTAPTTASPTTSPTTTFPDATSASTAGTLPQSASPAAGSMSGGTAPGSPRAGVDGPASLASVAPLGVVRRSTYDSPAASAALLPNAAAERQAAIAAATRTPGQPLVGDAPVQRRSVEPSVQASGAAPSGAAPSGAAPSAAAPSGAAPSAAAPSAAAPSAAQASTAAPSAGVLAARYGSEGVEAAPGDTTRPMADDMRVRPPAHTAPTSNDSRATPQGSQFVLPGAASSSTRDQRDNEQRGRHRPSGAAVGPVAAGLTPGTRDVLARQVTPDRTSSSPTSSTSPTSPTSPASATRATSSNSPLPTSSADSWTSSADSSTSSLPVQRATSTALLESVNPAPPARALGTLRASDEFGAPPAAAVNTQAGATPSNASNADTVVRRSPAPVQPPTNTATRATYEASGSPVLGTDPVAPQQQQLTRPSRPTRPTPDRFLDVLHATPTPALALQRLPQRFATLARAVTGGTDVVVRHDTAARDALAAVGKRAATIGNTIVLPERPSASTDIGVLAHELTHVAHPSLVPRFYADDHDSAEERQADAVAQLIRRSPTLRATAPSSPVSSSTSSSASSAPVIATHRSAAPASPTSSPTTRALTPPPPRLSAPSVAPPAPGALSATRAATASSASTSPSAATSTVRRSATSAPRVGRAASSNSSAVVRRSPASSAARHTAAAGAAAAGGGVVRRALTNNDESGGSSSGSSQPLLHDLIENSRSTGGVVDLVDWLVEQVEDRVVAELQRRGGRYREDF